MFKVKKMDMSWLKELHQNSSLVDWILWLVLAVFCFLFYQHGDVFHTGGSSITYLNGHILDFYDWNAQHFDYDAYMPTTYILFAIWNIPIRVLGLITTATMEASIPVKVWYKLGTTLVYLLTAVFVYKIVFEKTEDKKRAYFATFLFVANPIAMYSQFCFGQYDVFTTFFMVLGLYYYLKDDTKHFVVSFAIAITCKYFALLLFVPLVLLKQKDVVKDILQLIGGVSLFVLEVLVYYPSEGFRTGVFGFNASGYIFDASITISFDRKISLVIVGWLVLCAVSYLINVEKDKLMDYSIFILDIVLFLSFGMTFFHPQWVLMATPFLAITIAMNKHQDILVMVATILAFAYFGFVFLTWPDSVGNTLLNLGVFSDLFQGRPGSGMLLNKFYCRSDLSIEQIQRTSVYYTILNAMFLVFAIFSYPKFWEDKREEQDGKKRENYLLSGLFFFGALVAFFIIPTFVTVWHDFNVECGLAVLARNSTTATAPLDDDVPYEEVFYYKGSKMTAVALRVGYNGDGDKHGTLFLKIKDYETGEVLGTKEAYVGDLLHYQSNKILLDEPIYVEPGRMYELEITTEIPKDSPKLSLYYKEDANMEDGWAIFNGEMQAADLDMVVYGL